MLRSSESRDAITFLEPRSYSGRTRKARQTTSPPRSREDRSPKFVTGDYFVAFATCYRTTNPLCTSGMPLKILDFPARSDNKLVVRHDISRMPRYITLVRDISLNIVSPLAGQFSRSDWHWAAWISRVARSKAAAKGYIRCRQPCVLSTRFPASWSGFNSRFRTETKIEWASPLIPALQCS